MKYQFQFSGNNIQHPRQGDAGLDLVAAHGALIPPGTRGGINTTVRWKPATIPPFVQRIVKRWFGGRLEWVGIIKPRSGLALNHGIDVLAGVIDSSYRGEIAVLLLNTSDFPVEIHQGSKIAQMLVMLTFVPDWEWAEQIDSDSTQRGEDGFGSTGR